VAALKTSSPVPEIHASWYYYGVEARLFSLVRKTIPDKSIAAIQGPSFRSAGRGSPSAKNHSMLNCSIMRDLQDSKNRLLGHTYSLFRHKVTLEPTKNLRTTTLITG
jgi:hypothetical protein